MPLDQLERTKPVDAGARKGLMLTPAEWEQVLTHGTWSDIFTLDGITTTLAVPLWLLAVEVLGLAAFPLCWLLLPGPGRPRVRRRADPGAGAGLVPGVAGGERRGWRRSGAGWSTPA